MKGKSTKRIIFTFLCVIGSTVLIHAFSDLSWWAALGISSGVQTILALQDELRTLHHDLDQLDNYFSIADAELVRVSALATELEEKLGDLTIKYDELRAELVCR